MYFRFDRVLTSCLLALQALLSEFKSFSVSNGSKEIAASNNFPEELKQCFSLPLWKRITSTRPMIRKAIYSLLSFVVAQFPELLSSISNVISLVVAALNDSDIGNMSTVLHMVLMFAKAFPQFWNDMNISQSFIEKLSRMLPVLPDVVLNYFLPLLASISVEDCSVIGLLNQHLPAAATNRLLTTMKSVDAFLDLIMHYAESATIPNMQDNAHLAVVECATFLLLRKARPAVSLDIVDVSTNGDGHQRHFYKYISQLSHKVIVCSIRLCASNSSIGDADATGACAQYKLPLDSLARVLAQLHRATCQGLALSSEDWNDMLWKPLAIELIDLARTLSTIGLQLPDNAVVVDDAGLGDQLAGDIDLVSDQVHTKKLIDWNRSFKKQIDFNTFGKHLSFLLACTKRYLSVNGVHQSQPELIVDIEAVVGIVVVLQLVLKACVEIILAQYSIDIVVYDVVSMLSHRLSWCNFVTTIVIDNNVNYSLLPWMNSLQYSLKIILDAFCGPFLVPLLNLVTFTIHRNRQDVTNSEIMASLNLLESQLRHHYQNIYKLLTNASVVDAVIYQAIVSKLLLTIIHSKSLKCFVMIREVGLLAQFNWYMCDSSVLSWLTTVTNCILDTQDISTATSSMGAYSIDIVDAIQLANKPTKIKFIVICAELITVPTASSSSASSASSVVVNVMQRWRSTMSTFSCQVMLTILLSEVSRNSDKCQQASLEPLIQSEGLLTSPSVNRNLDLLNSCIDMISNLFLSATDHLVSTNSNTSIHNTDSNTDSIHHLITVILDWKKIDEFLFPFCSKEDKTLVLDAIKAKLRAVSQELIAGSSSRVVMRKNEQLFSKYTSASREWAQKLCHLLQLCDENRFQSSSFDVLVDCGLSIDSKSVDLEKIITLLKSSTPMAWTPADSFALKLVLQFIYSTYTIEDCKANTIWNALMMNAKLITQFCTCLFLLKRLYVSSSSKSIETIQSEAVVDMLAMCPWGSSGYEVCSKVAGVLLRAIVSANPVHKQSLLSFVVGEFVNVDYRSGCNLEGAGVELLRASFSFVGHLDASDSTIG